MLFDTFCFGVFMPLAHFRFWVVITLLNLLFSNTFRIGGTRFFARAVLFFGCGAGAGILWVGFHFEPSTEWSTTLLCAALLCLYFSFFSVNTYSMTREMIWSKKRLESAMHAVKEADRKKGEYLEQLTSANRRLQQSLQTLESAQDRLVQSEKMAALGGLVAGIAHEINTPLGIGITAASLLDNRAREYAERRNRGSKSPGDEEKLLKFVLESADILTKNLNRVADQVRRFKQLAVDQSSEEFRRINVRQYVEDVLFSLRPRFAGTQYSVDLRCADDIRFETYPGIFSQVITNLVMNSLIHGFDGRSAGAITIDIWIETGYVVLYYTDDGNGMDRDTLNRMFDPFFTTRRGHGGTGLGMHILYNLVTQSLGGQLECTSTPGEGIILLIRMPVKQAQSA